ncbi:MAG: gluconokinase [Luteolibacter sp.]
MKLVIAGVSGSGKTTIGTLVAKLSNSEFLDADSFHPPENVEKMRHGIPLTDADRAGWLQTLGTELQHRSDVVLACSALKKAYRDLLRGAVPDLQFALLELSKSELEKRIAGRARTGHFMPASLLDSQLATLETGEDLLVFENNDSPEIIARKIWEKTIADR